MRMRKRVRWLAVAMLGLIGCESLRTPALPSAIPSPPTAVGGLQPVSAQSPPTAVGGLPQADDPLTLAAQCLERGDQPGACSHLDAYVRQHPDQIMFRAHLAELLLKLDRLAEAKVQFEQFIADAQAATGTPRKHLVHCHTRLMEIAQRDDDRFAEVFHRGVGLLLVTRQMDAEPQRDEQMCEEILCKALKALNEAKQLRPSDPRVDLYLADVYERMGNRRGATTARNAARNTIAPGALTRPEQRSLALSGYSGGFTHRR